MAASSMNWKAIACFLLAPTAALIAQGFRGGPPMRNHTATQARPLQLEPATEKPPGQNQSTISESGAERSVRSNAIPDHLVGPFPSPGNPNRIAEQRYAFQIPANPRPQPQITWLHHPAGAQGPPNQPFGVALNGVLFDPGTAEFWRGDRDLGWNYEALGGAVGLGLDEHHAHVQPNGAYHYHGLPKPVMDQLALAPDQHSPIVGWAADGFPIYALRGHADPQNAASPMKTLRSSYSLKPGQRPAPPAGPGGAHDGAFVQDYQFVSGHGDLDECDGRICVTPEFPNGTYAYFLTAEWPVIPRGFRGEPASLRGEGGMTPGGSGKGKGKGKGKGPPSI
jgi:hypothetical protein